MDQGLWYGVWELCTKLSTVSVRKAVRCQAVPKVLALPHRYAQKKLVNEINDFDQCQHRCARSYPQKMGRAAGRRKIIHENSRAAAQEWGFLPQNRQLPCFCAT